MSLIFDPVVVPFLGVTGAAVGGAGAVPTPSPEGVSFLLLALSAVGVVNLDPVPEEMVEGGVLAEEAGTGGAVSLVFAVSDGSAREILRFSFSATPSFFPSFLPIVLLSLACPERTSEAVDAAGAGDEVAAGASVFAGVAGAAGVADFNVLAMPEEADVSGVLFAATGAVAGLPASAA